MLTGVISLPVEIQLKIFSYLPWDSRYLCSRASRVWRDILLTHGQDVIFDDTNFMKLEGVTSYVDTVSPTCPRFGIHSVFGENITLKVDDDKIIAFSIMVAGEVQWIMDFEKCYFLNDLIFEKINSTPDVRCLNLDVEIWQRRLARKKLPFTDEPWFGRMTVKGFFEFIVNSVFQQFACRQQTNIGKIKLGNAMQATYFIGMRAQFVGVFTT
ncbi:hypothetical protein AOL_s00081g350 [Orbilia oligospora ATCC 24927]|uniref:F-box domain-containing protein n=2 Tax=Orbilia oligospora TaxID=2813651 RepID=G1XG57_ARTOA|nr:hypothetical protein AOL_s00081g350 [Orbilia oligospora ATCC 24927]EGX48023.1 hypothetical protein AOL_s00081g350 [Orbilia oligospora ATCC 24927]KAF3274455.1 hypothetical protein TWF970_007968 [Orbilia oligospora]